MRPSYTELAAAQRQAEKARGKAAAAESALNKAQQVVEREEELLHMANGAKADVRMMQARAELAEHTAKAQAQRADRAEKALNACRKEFYAYRKAGREVRKTIAMLTFAVLMVGAAVYAIVTIGSAPRWAVMMPFLGGVAMGAALLISDCAEMGKEAGEHSERGTGDHSGANGI